MKFLVFLVLQVVVVCCQEKTIKMEASCLTGTAARPPKEPHLNYSKANVEFACAYGEARCDGLLYCGTPPCHWRCWCQDGFKRLGDNCVKICPLIAIKNPVFIE